MKTPLIAGNWKMNNTHHEAIKLVQQITHELAGHNFQKVEVAVHPPFTSLRTVQTLIENDRLELVLGAQNMYFESSGAYTGEVSPGMLKALRVRYVILGHSERREVLDESDEDVNKKVRAAFQNDLIPIMCCGETESEREAGGAESKIEGQIKAGLQGVKPEQVSSMVVAYEPIWAIGSGKTATPDDAQEMISYIRTLIAKEHSGDVAEDVRVLYGGSVKAGNAKALMGQPDIDGALVGGASLDAGEFCGIVKGAV